MGRWERDVLRAIRGASSNGKRPSTALGMNHHDAGKRSIENAHITRVLQLLGVIEIVSEPSEPQSGVHAEKLGLVVCQSGAGLGQRDEEGHEVETGEYMPRGEARAEPGRVVRGKSESVILTPYARAYVPVKNAAKEKDSTGVNAGERARTEADVVPVPEKIVAKIVKSLLRGTSTVAIAAARPLGITSPPVLMTDSDEVCRLQL